MKKLIIILCVFIFLSCQEKDRYQKFSGETMGTYYKVSYEGVEPIKVKKDIEDLLESFNNSLSTYIPTSLISRLNDSEQGIELPDDELFFEPVLKKSNQLKIQTEGRLNTAILPMLNYWRDNTSTIDSSEARRLKDLVLSSDFDIIERENKKHILKSDPNAKLDFSSLAKGYGIDVLAQYFFDSKIENFLIDIGGEARANGKNSIGHPWTLAINTPREKGGLKDSELILQLQDQSIATSGAYRQFYEKDGKRIAHIMDPNTGFSATSDILSASVVVDDCMTADGLATALMICNLEEAKFFLVTNRIAACLIYDGDGKEPLEKYYANGFENLVVQAK